MPQPSAPKIYHIVHVDRLPLIINEGGLLCDTEIVRRIASDPAQSLGTTIGMDKIKRRRTFELTLTSYPDLHVGQCVPFYFCPRSVMLFIIHRAEEPELKYRGGQEPIVHLEADLHQVVNWANQNDRRWAFTLSNAGAYYFEDRSSLDQLDEINWNAVQAKWWSGAGVPSGLKDGKQAEFLLEQSLPWELVAQIGVHSQNVAKQVNAALQAAAHKPHVQVKKDWYY